MRIARLITALLVPACNLASISAQTPVGNPPSFSLKQQPYQRPQSCLPCHQRQYDELRSSVKSGYRNVSPLFNGLETSANLITGGLLRPVYADSTKKNADGTSLNSNMFSSKMITNGLPLRAGCGYTCHTSNKA